MCGETLRTSSRACSASFPLRSGTRKSSAWQAQSSSMARMFLTLAMTGCSFNAAAIPMLTKSSLLPEVGMESAEAGCASTLFSDAKAAAATCAIISPDSRPGEWARNAGSSEVRGFTIRSTRLSAIAPSWVRAMAIRSSARASGCP